ncbi:MAG TPA: extracellular solute-binding protein [Herbaspirillum sp.]
MTDFQLVSRRGFDGLFGKFAATLALGLGIILPMPLAAWAQTTAKEPAALVAAALKEGRLTLLTANHAEDEKALVTGFNKKYPGIKVEVSRGVNMQILPKIEAGAQKGQLDADIVSLTERSAAIRMSKYYTDYAPPNANDYETLGGKREKIWTRFVFAPVIAYNSQLVTDPPKDWMDVLDPKYAGKVGIVTIESGGTSWTLGQYQRIKVNPDYWSKLAAIKPVIYSSGAQLGSALISGEVQIGFSYLSVLGAQIAQGAPIKVLYPKSGVPGTPEATAILLSAKHPNAAKLYMDYALSKEGQEIVVGLGHFTLLKSVQTAHLADRPTLWFASAEENARRDQWIKEWAGIFGVGK